MVMAAGKHALVIHLCLEGNVFGMLTSVYEEIVAHDPKGKSDNPNLTRGENEERCRLVRSFQVPSKYTVEGAKNPLEMINILAPFVSGDWTFVISDFINYAICML